jgi:hypothetical protein
VRLNYKQEMVLQLSHKKKDMVVPVIKKKEMVTHTLRVQLTRGEVNEELLRRYEMEANGDERGLEEDSSDDEDDPLVPRDWDSYNFSQLFVNPSENVAWEYREMSFLLASCIRVQ